MKSVRPLTVGLLAVLSAACGTPGGLSSEASPGSAGIPSESARLNAGTFDAEIARDPMRQTTLGIKDRYGDAERETNRCIVMPAQATAYTVGLLKILELRQRAQDRLGARFDIRAFHDVVLRNGALPLALLEEVVDDWNAETAA